MASSPTDILAERLKPLLRQHKIARNHPLDLSHSGVPRIVHFFVNSGRNVALDGLRLDLKQADEIRRRADAQAFKVWDVINARAVSKYLVYCEFPETEELRESRDAAEQVISAAGAEVIEDAGTATVQLARAAGSY